MSDEKPDDQEKPGGPPQPPPPGYPAYPTGSSGPYQPQQTGGNGRIWLGVALTIPAMFLVVVLAGAAGAVDSSGATSGLIVLAGIVAPIVMLFFDQTRKLAIGLLIGAAIVFILFAGACVALIASYQ